MSKSLQNKDYGHHGSASQPGTSTPRKLRSWAASGLGEFGAFQREVNRMFRTEQTIRSAPHVIDADDVFKGLNLDSETEGKLRAVLTRTRSDFGADPKLRVPRVVHARIRLMDTMRGMKHIDSDTRMEILRRAQSFWKRNGAGSSYNQPAVVRYVPMGKSNMRHMITLRKSDRLMKGGPFVGPKGGLWQDANHTVPYKRSDHIAKLRGQEKAHAEKKPKPKKRSFLQRVTGRGKPGPVEALGSIGHEQKADDLRGDRERHERQLDKHGDHQLVATTPRGKAWASGEHRKRDVHARHRISSSEVLQHRERTKMRGKAKKQFDDPSADKDDDGVPNALDERPGEPGEGAGETKGPQGKGGKDEKGDSKNGGPTHPKDRKAPQGGEFESLDPESQMQVIDEAVAQGAISEEEAEEARAEIGGGQEVSPEIVSAVEAMEEHEVDGGRMLDFGNDVTAHLPDDADFHHHATEYAKHRAGHLINKDKDPAKADAHKHAANIHASIGNAMHQAGDTERRRLPGSDGSGTAESHSAALDQAEASAQTPGGPEPEDLPMPGGPLGTNGVGGGPGGGKAPAPPPGAEAKRDEMGGAPQQGMPDMERNPPARDSDLEVAQAMSGKLSQLMGKLSGKAGRAMTSAERTIAHKDAVDALTPETIGKLNAVAAGMIGKVKQVHGGGTGHTRRPKPPAPPQAEVYRHQSDAGTVVEKHAGGRVTQHIIRGAMKGKRRGQARRPGGAATHPVSEKQRRWAFAAEERGQLPRGKALEWSRRVKGQGGSSFEPRHTKASLGRMVGRFTEFANLIGKQGGARRAARPRSARQAGTSPYWERVAGGGSSQPRDFGESWDRFTGSGRQAVRERRAAVARQRLPKRVHQGSYEPTSARETGRREAAHRRRFRSGMDAPPADAAAAPSRPQPEGRTSTVQTRGGRTITLRRPDVSEIEAGSARPARPARPQRRRRARAARPQLPPSPETQQAPQAAQPPAAAAPAQPAARPASTQRVMSTLDRLVATGRATPELFRSDVHFVVPSDRLYKGKKGQPFAGGFSEKEARRAARSIGVDFGRVKYRFKDFHKGMNHEREHKKVSRAAKTCAQIAVDHLAEDPQYYRKLARIEA